MPAQQGRRLDEEVSEAVAGEESCESRQHRPVRRLQRRSVQLASKDCHLVTQDRDLDGEVGVTAEDESDELEEAAERPVEERESHGRMLAAPGASRQSPAHSPMDDLLGGHALDEAERHGRGAPPDHSWLVKPAMG